MPNDTEGVKKSLNGSKKALQYIRRYANSLKIIPTKIIVMGSSAGASTALWLAFHDDMSNKASEDRTERQSTRVLAAIATETQSTLDVVKWENIFSIYNMSLNPFSSAITPLFGISTLDELYDSQIIPSRLESIIAVTPVAPVGLRCDEAMADIFRGLALGDDEQRLKTMTTFWGERLSQNWIKFKLRSWRETASAEAAAKYVDMWGCTDISEGAKNIEVPMLIVACLEDSLPFIPDSLERTMLPFYSKARMHTVIEAGHYPMQEQPPMMATLIEHFLIDKK